MLSRFVGVVTLHVDGGTDETLEQRLAEQLQRLREIDTRPQRVLERAYGPPSSDAAVVLTVGTTDAIYRGPQQTATEHIAFSFSAWTCEMRRGVTSQVQDSVPSTVPFGAMAGACFAVAEVFKTLLASCLAADDQLSFRKRYVMTWRYSVWNQERILSRESDAGTYMGPDFLPSLIIDSRTLLQVGAGAVGNATAYAFSETEAIEGDLPVLDVKHVDEKNLNRCVYFRERHVGHQKVSVLADEAGHERLRLDGTNHQYADDDGRECFIILALRGFVWVICEGFSFAEGVAECTSGF